MEITSVTISNDKTQLDVTITDAASLIRLTYWNNTTYKDYTKAIDFTSKLTASATENITITLAEINEDYFDGIYFLEAEDPTETSIDYAYEITKYHECLVDVSTKYSTCDSCSQKVEDEMLNKAVAVQSLEYSLEDRLIDEMINQIRALDKMCSNRCKTCGSYGNVKTVDPEKQSNFDPVVVKIDGGSLD